MKLTSSTVEGAITSGRKNVIYYLIQQKRGALPYDVEADAASRGDIDMLKYMRKYKYAFTSNACRLAAKAGHLPALQPEYMLSTMSCECEEGCDDDLCELCA
jgi:hypothetical protein